MSEEKNGGEGDAPETVTEENKEEKTATEEKKNVVELSREEYDKLNQTIGSLKRDVKDLTKGTKESKTPDSSKTEDTGLSDERFDRLALKTAKIVDKDEVQLAKDLKEKLGVEMDEVLEDDYFLAKLEKLREQKANEVATTDIKGDKGEINAKNSVEYWKAKGHPPTPEDVPDAKTRRKIVRAMLPSSNPSGIKFYNEK